MKIKKRNGKFEQLSVDKIINRLKKIKNDTTLGKLKTIDTDPIALKIVSSIYDGVTSSELDEEAARIAIGMTENIEYSTLASRIIISNLHKNTSICFSDTMESLNNNIDKNGNVVSLLSDKFIENVRKYKDQIDSYIVYERDYSFDYFGFKTMERTYLMKIDGKVIERPQHMYMRVAIQTNFDNIDNILKTYDYISQHYFTFASPTNFNSGSKQNNLSSCFLLHTNDSVDEIFKTISDVAKISKVGGGLGIHINNIRSKGSLIRGSNGVSDGIIPMLKVYNELSAYINQCFTPDTWVYSQKGPKQIKDITIDDNLITIDGSFKKINEIIKNTVNKEILKIKTTNSLFPVKVTKEHELYLLKDCKKSDYTVIKKGLQNGSIKPDYYSADKLTLDDLVGFPIPMHVLDNDNNDLDYYKFYGLMLHLGEKNGNEYKITFKKHTESLFIKYYLKKCNIEYWSGSNYYTFTETDSVTWTVKPHLNMDDSYLHLPKDKTLKLIEGLMCNGDIFQHVSKKLVIQTRYLLLRMGILTTGYIKDDVYHLKKTIKNKDYFEYENMLWGKVSYIHLMEYSGDVYDFNIIDNHNYMTEMGLVHNSGKRKGSIAFYLSPEHPDILEFLNLRKNNGAESLRARNLFLAMWISDLFMKQVEKNGDWYLMDPDECPGLDDVYGDEFETLYWKYVEEKRYRKIIKAQEIWSKIIESQIETGTPYMLYKDPSNKKSNQKNIGTIKSSNLCVAPETMILTSTGYYKIKELEGQNIKIWNGQEFTETTVRKTGENQELIKVKLSNGTELECTPYHKFYIATGKRPSDYPKIKKIEAKDLKKDMKLIKCEYPIIKEGLSDFPYPYEHGLFSADGTIVDKKDTIFQCNYKALDGECYCGHHIKMYEKKDNDIPTIYCKANVGQGNPRLSLYGEKKKLVKYISTRLEVLPEKSNRLDVRLPVELKPKFTVPINYNLNIKLKWLEGLCDGDGCVCKSEDLTAIQICSINREFLENTKFLLQTLGCDPKIVTMHDELVRLLPKNDGTNELGEYNCQTCYRLLLTSWDTANLYKLGFRPKRLNISGIYPKNNTKRWIQVEEIIQTNRISDTFCFTEEKRGMGIFNGIITGQCAEVLLYSGKDEYATCNLLSVSLPKFIKYDQDNKPYYDFQELYETVKFTILPMNNVIDFNFYPVPETANGNFRNRPVGIGTQGFNDLCVRMRFPFESKEADQLNKEIWETMYYATLYGSMELAKQHGPYSTFKGSPLSEGKFQFDLWKEYDNIDLNDYLSGRWDWETLRQDIIKHGVRNSTLLCQMPTATSALIMNNTESVECMDSCIYKRKTLSGEFTVFNKELVRDLTALGLWNKELKDTVIANNGSIQNIDTIPDNIKLLYKTVWEINMKTILNQAKSRGVFICQTQSTNCFFEIPTVKKLSSMHFYSWKLGLKTGMYYCRSKPKAASGQFTIDASLEKKARKKKPTEEEILSCSIDNQDMCDLCTS